jgi:glutamate-1-semialdehyde 2,1-aminomutase
MSAPSRDLKSSASLEATERLVEEAKRLLISAERIYVEQNQRSKKQHILASESLPGGNTRSVLYTDPFPICMEKGEANKLVDVDGHE